MLGGRRLRASREQFPGAVDRLDEPVDLLLGVVDVEGGAGGGGDAELVVQRLGAVVAGADGDGELVQDLGGVVSVDVPEVERDQRPAVAARRAVHLDVALLGEAVVGILRETAAVPVDVCMPMSSR